MIVRGKVINGWLGRWLPVAAWMVFIFFLSAQPSLPSPEEDWLEELRNIAGHFTVYVVLALLVSRAAAPDGRLSKWRMILVVLGCAAYALSDEWHQSYVPGRDASVFDLAVDVLGVLAGLIVYVSRRSNKPVDDVPV
jgi:VanZ family protein